MRITSVMLCDFAQVREGLTFISSGNVTRISREAFPASLDVNLSLTFFPDLGVGDFEAEIRAELFDLPRPEGQTEPLSGVGFTFSAGVGDPSTPAAIQIAVPTGQMIVPSPGTYRIETYVNETSSAVDFVALQV